jgi:hypothetical protein
MKTLFEKLKPEVLELLKLEATEYPATVEALIEKMSNMIWWTELKMSDAIRLVQINKPYSNFDMNAVINLFKEEENGN